MVNTLRAQLTQGIQSLRWRLVAWYIVLLIGILLLFSGSTYVVVYTLLQDNFDDLLTSQANLIVQTIDFTDHELVLQNDTLSAGRISDEHLTRIVRADGTLIFDDNPRERDPALAAAVQDAVAGQQHLINVSGHEGPLRVLTLPITRAGQVVGALQIGLSLEDLHATMRTLLKVMLVLTPALLLLASGGGLFLANRALSPIDQITRSAQRISSENLGRRLDLRRATNDEVGRLAITLDAMLGRLQMAFEQQRRFTADASHELRTPLAAMIGQIDVAIAFPRDTASYRATLLAVRVQAQRLTRLANDLLFLARTDSPPTPSAPEVAELVDLGDLLPAIMAQVAPLAEAKQQTLACADPPSLLMRGNEDDLIRLFLNLLDNAIRYTPSGGRISVSCAQADAQLVISVADSGPGIAPEHLPQLFERFFRVDRGRNRAQGGSGLGLSIAQSIAQAHGGRLLVESMLGQGSTFTALLPRHHASGECQPAGIMRDAQ